MNTQNCFRFTLRNCWDGTTTEIEAISWEVDNKTYQHSFQVDKNGYIVELSYNTKNWDLINVDKL